jgi:hypothetical protein
MIEAAAMPAATRAIAPVTGRAAATAAAADATATLARIAVEFSHQTTLQLQPALRRRHQHPPEAAEVALPGETASRHRAWRHGHRSCSPLDFQRVENSPGKIDRGWRRAIRSENKRGEASTVLSELDRPATAGEALKETPPHSQVPLVESLRTGAQACSRRWADPFDKNDCHCRRLESVVELVASAPVSQPT